ncbi:hypothetical protein CDIK_4171, partial [Cucumispora dikerogammari]
NPPLPSTSYQGEKTENIERLLKIGDLGQETKEKPIENDITSIELENIEQQGQGMKNTNSENTSIETGSLIEDKKWNDERISIWVYRGFIIGGVSIVVAITIGLILAMKFGK